MAMSEIQSTHSVRSVAHGAMRTLYATMSDAGPQALPPPHRLTREQNDAWVDLCHAVADFFEKVRQ